MPVTLRGGSRALASALSEAIAAIDAGTSAFDAVGDDLWQRTRRSLASHPLSESTVHDLAERFAFPWPRSRPPERFSSFLARDLHELAEQAGFGGSKLATLCRIAARLCEARVRSLDPRTRRSTAATPSFAELVQSAHPLASIDAATWDAWRRQLLRAGREGENVASIAARIGLPWPATRAEETLADYLSAPLPEIQARRGLGSTKLRTLLLCAAYLLDPVHAAPAPGASSPSFARLQTLAERADAAMADLRTPGRVRDPGERSLSLVRDLLDYTLLLKPRSGVKERAILEQRLGLTPDSHRLRHIADRLGLTHERVRQVLRDYGDQLRRAQPAWPDKIRSTCEALLATEASGAGARALFRLAGELLDVDVPAWKPAGGDISRAVDRIVRLLRMKGVSPASLDEVVAQLQKRVSVEFRHSAVREDLRRRNLLLEHGGKSLVYSGTTADRIHRLLLERGSELSASQISQETHVDREDVLRALQRDPRLLQKDDQRWIPLELTPFTRSGRAIRVPLSDAATGLAGGTADLEELCSAARDHLAGLGIPSVTYEGFHRLCGEVAERIFSAPLLPSVTPILLYQVAIDQTRLFESHRKRRIVLSGMAAAHEHYNAGYWIHRVISGIRQPCLPRDVFEGLRECYQDADPAIHGIWLLSSQFDGRYRLAQCREKRVAVVVPQPEEPGSWVGPGTPRLLARVRALSEENGGFHDFVVRELPWLRDFAPA